MEADDGKLNTAESRLLNAWYASQPQDRVRKLRDTYPFYVLNDRQLCASAGAGMTLDDFIRQDGRSSLQSLGASGPITHTPPEVPEKTITIPLATKARLGLDSENSWIITTEVNRFIWPGPDVRDTPRGRLTYGHLPATMTRDVVQQIKANAGDRSLLVVSRDDETLNATLRRHRKPKKI